MRTQIVAGNWKMNTTLLQGVELFNQIQEEFNGLSGEFLKVVIAPPFTHLSKMAELKKGDILLAAQNCSHEKNGALTGEVSAEMVKSTGADCVIIGHSERRKHYNENDFTLKSKVDVALENNLLPIFCCGEGLEERESGEYLKVVDEQVKNVLFHLKENEFGKVIVAYEPIWAIGTGKTATPEEAQEVHEYIRTIIEEKYGDNIANATTILYGGSCNADNARTLFSQDDIDGGLIGGASLNAEEFVAIMNSFNPPLTT